MLLFQVMLLRVSKLILYGEYHCTKLHIRKGTHEEKYHFLFVFFFRLLVIHCFVVFVSFSLVRDNHIYLYMAKIEKYFIILNLNMYCWPHYACRYSQFAFKCQRQERRPWEPQTDPLIQSFTIYYASNMN